MSEISNLLDGPYIIGPIDDFHEKSSSAKFNTNVDSMVDLHYFKNIRYVCCNNDSKWPVRHVIIFPTFHEATFLMRVCKMEKLKGFL